MRARPCARPLRVFLGADRFDQPVQNIGLHIEVPFLIDPVDLGQFGHRRAGDEVGQRHQPVARADLERIKRAQHPVIFGQAHANFDLFIRGIDAHGVEQQATGNQLHHRAHSRHIRTVAPGFLHIHVDLPVDAGQGARVFDLDHTGGGVEFLTCQTGGIHQVLPVVPLDAQMHGLCAGRALGKGLYIRFDTRNFGQFGRQLFQDRVAVKVSSFDLAHHRVVDEWHGEPRLHRVGAFVPWNGLKLDLANGIIGRLRAARVGVQPAVPGKGKGAANARVGVDHRFGLVQQGILFLKAKVAACQHIDQRLFRLGRDKELDAPIVVDEIDQGRADKDKDKADHHQRHHRIAHDSLDCVAKGGALVARPHFARTSSKDCAQDPAHPTEDA
mmetsp:Transcript_22798/g.37904  ORF Transcript_22798/g.37904 Transcript_22798/m.37904 type:complete len:385 (+) Transcript_22798:4775-5929(+)